jgi:hypothetical protein
MVAKPFTIDTMPTFPRQGDVVDFFKAMLARYQDGARVSKEDERHLLALLKHHTDYAEKVRAGIDHFTVDKNTDYHPVTRCFWIVRFDGSIVDMSFYHCIKKSTL